MSIVQILSNSLHHAFTGDEKNAWTEIECSDEDNVFTCIVEDNGRGIPESQKNTLFQPFSTLSHSENHSGLGLYIAQAHVSGILGGIITHEPSEEGTRMKLTALIAQ